MTPSLSPSQSSKEELSPIAARLKARKRPVLVFDVGQQMGLGPGVEHVAIRVPTSRETDLALAQAEDYAIRLAEKTPSLAKDPAVLEDTRAAFIVATAVRDVAGPDKMPAFPSGGWIKDTLENDRIAVLLNLLNETRAKLGPGPIDISDATIEATAEMCVVAAGTDLPEAKLAAYSREHLTHSLVLVSVKLYEARQLAADAEVAHDFCQAWAAARTWLEAA